MGEVSLYQREANSSSCALDPNISSLRVIPFINFPHHFNILPLVLSHSYLTASWYHLKRMSQPEALTSWMMEGKKAGGKYGSKKKKRREKLASLNLKPWFIHLWVLYTLYASPLIQASTSPPPKCSSTYLVSVFTISLKHHDWPLLPKSKGDFPLLSHVISLLHWVLLDIPSTELPCPWYPWSPRYLRCLSSFHDPSSIGSLNGVPQGYILERFWDKVD